MLINCGFDKYYFNTSGPLSNGALIKVVILGSTFSNLAPFFTGVAVCFLGRSMNGVCHTPAALLRFAHILGPLTLEVR